MLKSTTGRFFLGFIMFTGGLYLLLDAIRVNMGLMFHRGHSLFNINGIGITSGYILLLFMLGVGMLFFNAKNILGWLLTAGSLVGLIVGVISKAQLSLAHMSVFELLMILIMLCGGLGLLASSMIQRKD